MGFEYRQEPPHGGLEPFVLYTADGQEIPLRVMKSAEGKVLLECLEAELLLSYIDRRQQLSFGPGTVVRGVFFPGQGTIFELFDSLGSLNTPMLRLSEKETEDLLLSHLW